MLASEDGAPKRRGRIITIQLGRRYVKQIDAFVVGRVAINRSCFMRDAVTQTLLKILVDGDVECLNGLDENALTSTNYIITVNLTKIQVEAIDALVPSVSPSRSQFVRNSLLLFIRQTDKFVAAVKGLKEAPAQKRAHAKVTDMRRVPW